jgi:cell division protein FtsQ
MIKKILLFLSLLAVLAYLGIAITQLNNKPKNRICRNIELSIKDSLNDPYLTRGDIILLLKQQHLYPVGKNLDHIQPRRIEAALKQHPLIEHVESYKTTKDELAIDIYERMPVLRVMNDQGENFFIDSHNKVMHIKTNCAINVPIVTGHAEKSFVMRDLYNFGVFLQKNKFWNAQIEQINVLPTHEIELIPLVGDQVIFMGKIVNYEQKLSRLKRFYQEALNKVGWNKYSRINLEFGNQIICTKKEK